ncbi:helix-turn-helix domain-containing protein [Puia sp.]|uniref:helix-turn-helix domain-containing protein n=1 Tax=Puia sp. TaxID=2045100 RepID=UPI0039C941FA
MVSKSSFVLPRLEKILAQLGENLKLGRLRRKLTTTQVAERAGIMRTTLWQVEKGATHVSMRLRAGTFRIRQGSLFKAQMVPRGCELRCEADLALPVFERTAIIALLFAGLMQPIHQPVFESG